MATEIISKRCSKCKILKPISTFNKDSQYKDGYFCWCKQCKSQWNQKYLKTENGIDVNKRACTKYSKTQKGKAVAKAVNKRYHQSEKGKASQKRYRQSKKGKATAKRYNKSEEGKARDRRHRQSTKGKTHRNQYQKQYRKSENGKVAKKRYQESIKGKNCFARYRLICREHIFAASAVRKAIKTRKIPPATKLCCHYCSEQAQIYHHNLGYAPEHYLDVIPVCRKCHGIVHSQTPILAPAVG